MSTTGWNKTFGGVVTKSQGFFDVGSVMNVEDTLMASLPYAQAGYMLRNTLTMLFFLYVRTMELQEAENAQFSHMDDHMIKVFCEETAAFYVDANVPKMTMEAAVEQGKIKAPMSTQDVIRAKRPDFNGEKTPF